MPEINLDQNITQSQEQKQSQRLIVSQKHQQAIELLQYPSLELKSWLNEKMQENPLLDLDDGASRDTEPEDDLAEELEEEELEEDELDLDTDIEQLLDDRSGYQGFRNSTQYNPDETHPEDQFRSMARQHQTLQDSLLWQLELSEFEGEDRELAERLISHIDRDGFFQGELEEIASDLDVNVEKLQSILSIIQDFEPTGVGARSLQESLLIQLEHQEGSLPEKSFEIIENHLEELQNRQFKKVSREHGYDVEVVQEVADRLQDLEPRPGRLYDEVDRQYITPDVVLKEVDAEREILINESDVPPLKISNKYREMLNSDDEETREYVKEKLKGALWILHCIYQRHRTLYEVTHSIVEHQSEFFENGVKSLKPLVLKDIAEDIDVHESTVSRAIQDKYMQTSRGMFPLKFFFSSSLETEEGEEDVSSTAVKARIQELVDHEDPTNPLSDSSIKEKLNEEGIQIGRRTISKYRKQLNILPWNLRRRACEKSS
ncbi:MAG: RNA polymerase factor sigma-54 [bacterium]